jgi:hypothetical protein
LKKAYTIIQDTRERQPLIFPSHLVVSSSGTRRATVTITVVEKQILTGDYLVDGFEDCCVVERKKNLDEIAANCGFTCPAGELKYQPSSRKRHNFIAELERLRKDCKYPVLFFEGSPIDLLNSTSRIPTPEPVIHSFLDLMMRYNMGVHFAPMATLAQRRRAGEWAAHLLIQGAIS